MRVPVWIWMIIWLEGALVDHFLKEIVIDALIVCRYYSHAMLGCLQRNIAIPLWANLRENGRDTSLERALGGFDLFVPQCGIDSLEEVGIYCIVSPWTSLLTLDGDRYATCLMPSQTMYYNGIQTYAV